MQSKHLDVSHVIMVVDPMTAHWQTALKLAESLTDCAVKTTLACINPPSPTAKLQASNVQDIEIKAGVDAESLEWMLFLETLVSPDIIQVFSPEHVLLPWKAPTVFHVPDRDLVHPDKSLFAACAAANLIVVEDEDRFERLQGIVGTDPFIAVLKCEHDCGWNYFLAYQEIVQSTKLDLGGDAVGRFELI